VDKPESKQPPFIAVALIFDQQSKWLNADLKITDIDPAIDYQSLQDLIRAEGYESFRVPPKALEDVIRKIRKGETGTVALVKKPEYTAINFSYDERTRKLSADLISADEDPKLSWASLQEFIRENNYESFQIQGKVLQDLLKRAANHERGSFVIGERPVYTQVQLRYDEDTRILSAVLSATDHDPKITLAVLQEWITAGGYDAYLSKDTVLEALHKRITNKERGSFPIGEKPQYTGLQLVFDQSTNVLNATLAATDEDPNISLQTLQEMIKNNHYDQLFFEPDALDKLFERIKKKERGIFPLAQCKDAEIFITVSDDEMCAFLTTTPAYGGKKLTQSSINAAIANAGIDAALCDQVALKKALESGAVTELKFAKGKEPVTGLNTRFEALVEEVIYHAPSIDKKSDKADLHEIQDFTVVKPGQPLMQRIPATAGINGQNVLGKVLMAQPGEDLPFSTLTDDVIIDPADSNKLIANAKGHPVIMKDGARIDKTLKVANVDIKTGNITLDGSLLVIGEVKTDMEIDVTGDVIVNDIVAGASIKAGNNIIIKGGIVGSPAKHSPQNSLMANLSAGGNIQARFASLASLTAGKNIEIAEYIAHSEVRAKEKVLLGQAGGKGCLIGGNCYAEEGVVINVAGTDAGVKTLISVGYASELQKNHDDLVDQKAVLNVQAVQLTAVFRQYMEQHKQQPLSPEKLNKAKVIKNTVTALKAEIAAIDNQITSLKTALKSVKTSDIIVKKEMYPNVEVTVNGKELLIRQQTKGGHFVVDGNDLKWTAL
jgi:uncharacterized protein (DUF342 family)